MCGLTGFCGKKNFHASKIKLLLLFNEERGKDSTGVYTPALDEILKDTERSSKWITTNHFDEDKLLIGHTRAKTRGHVNKANAHPFKYGTTIGAHNGTLDNMWNLCSKNSLDFNSYDVDSQVIIKLLDKDKNPSVLYDFEGAAAVLFTNENENNTKTNVLYAFRNSERPLYYGNTTEGMYISSLKCSLEAIEAEDIKSFEENYLYKIVNGEIKEKLNIPREDKDNKTTTASSSCFTSNYAHSARHINTTSTNAKEEAEKTYPIGCYVYLNPEAPSVKNNTQTKLKVGKFYEVVDIDYMGRLIIEFEADKRDWFSKILFMPPLVLESDSYGICVSDLESKKTGKEIANAGDLCYVQVADYKKGEIDFIGKEEGRIFVTPINYLRALTPEEEQKHKTTLAKTTSPADDEEETQLNEENFKIGDTDVNGNLIDTYLELFNDDLNSISNIFKEACSGEKGAKGYLTVEQRAKFSALMSDITTAMYEFVYEAKGLDSDDDTEENPAEDTKKEEECPTQYPAD